MPLDSHDPPSGALVERVEYDDYGLPTVHSQADRFASARSVSAYGNNYLYTGREWNATAGLYDYRHRQYDPFTGSFLTVDPIGQWGDALNLGNGYAYVGGNPWRWVDPWGFEAICTIKASQMDKWLQDCGLSCGPIPYYADVGRRPVNVPININNSIIDSIWAIPQIPGAVGGEARWVLDRVAPDPWAWERGSGPYSRLALGYGDRGMQAAVRVSEAAAMPTRTTGIASSR